MIDVVEIIARAIRFVDAVGNGMDLEDTLFSGGSDAKATTDAAAQAVLSALDAAGYAVVPKEPTEAMRIAGYNVAEECGGAASTTELTAVFKAMIAATKQDT